MTPFASTVGQPVSRREDDRQLRGQASFVADLPRGQVLYAAFVRSMYSRGAIKAVQTQATRSMEGVVAVYSAQDLPDLKPLPVNPICSARPFPNPVLAKGQVLYVGQPVALVLAQTPQAAQAAAEQVMIDITPLPPVIGIEGALTGPAVMEGWQDNIAYRQDWRTGDFASMAQQADRVVDITIETSRLAPSPMEPRGMLALWQQGGLFCHLPSQAPHRARQTLADLLGLTHERVHVICPQVGGAFGGRASVFPEEVAIAWACAHLRQAISWQASRGEDLIAASHGRASRLKAWAAFSKEGRLQALKARLDFDLGSWAPFSALIPGWNAGRILPGPYAVPVVDIVSQGLITNTAAVGIYRGAGRPEAALVMERLMDEAAAQLGIDPVEIRDRNLPEDIEGQVLTTTGQTMDGRRAQSLLRQATQVAGYTALRQEVKRRQAQGECVGLGINLYVEPCGMGWESARISIEPDGRFQVASGSSSQGQGHDTAFAQIAAAALGVSIDRIDVIEADTRQTPEGIGALASRSMAIGGSAVEMAAESLVRLMAKTPAHAQARLSVTEVYTAAAEAWSGGCCMTLIRVDSLTGQIALERVVWVDDCGGLINPLLAEGQLVGGFAQGFGETFLEGVYYDADGQILTGSFMDYALPRADDLIALEIAHHHRPTGGAEATHARANLLGVSGVGESGTIAAPAALVNALIDALPSHARRGPIALPLKPETIWRMMGKRR